MFSIVQIIKLRSEAYFRHDSEIDQTVLLKETDQEVRYVRELSGWNVSVLVRGSSKLLNTVSTRQSPRRKHRDLGLSACKVIGLWRHWSGFRRTAVNERGWLGR